MKTLQLRVAGPLGRGRLLRYSLLSTPLLDELVWGFPVLALPLIRDDLGLSYAQAGLLFTVGEISSLVFEPALNVLSDRGSKRWPVLGGMLALAAGFGLAALAPNLVWLLVAFALLYPASGAAVGLSQAVLVDDDLSEAQRTMTRWTLMAAVGDLLAPPVVATALALGLGWRPLFWLAAALWVGAAATIWRQRFPIPGRTEAQGEAGTGVLAGLREAVRDPRLLRWVAVVLLTSLLDEVFLGFAALYLSEVLGIGAATVSLVLGAQLAGGIVGLVVLDRLVGRFAPEPLLRGMSLLALAGVAGLLLARSSGWAAAALLVLGFGASGWYPLAQAGAYAALPGRSGTVRAVIVALGAPVSVGLPLGVGLVSESFGIAAGVGFLGLAPIAVLLIVPRSR